VPERNDAETVPTNNANPRGNEPPRHRRTARHVLRGWAALLGCLVGTAVADPLGARFVDKKDGAFDVSDHLLKRRGALPVPIVITEPAVGSGGGAALLYFRDSLADARERSQARGERMSTPDIGGLAAFKTANGSQGVAAGYFGTLQGDRFRYLAGVAKAELNLDLYGPLGKARRFALDAPVLLAQGLARIGASDWFVGARYIYVGTSVRFDLSTPAEVTLPELTAHIGRLSLVVDYDSRDNIFTPTRGSYVEADVGAARPGLGGNTSFDSVFLRGFTYLPLGSSWVLGLRGDAKFTSGDLPFFARPFVALRGVPALRYQGSHTVVGEGELRWQLDPRWSLLGFAGVGKAYGDRVAFADAKSVAAGGAGIRYLIARKLGLHVGLDVARGPENTVVYLQVGSAWN
jgi:hypothetical protein